MPPPSMVGGSERVGGRMDAGCTLAGVPSVLRKDREVRRHRGGWTGGRGEQARRRGCCARDCLVCRPRTPHAEPAHAFIPRRVSHQSAQGQPVREGGERITRLAGRPKRPNPPVRAAHRHPQGNRIWGASPQYGGGCPPRPPPPNPPQTGAPRPPPLPAAPHPPSAPNAPQCAPRYWWRLQRRATRRSGSGSWRRLAAAAAGVAAVTVAAGVAAAGGGRAPPRPLGASEGAVWGQVGGGAKPPNLIRWLRPRGGGRGGGGQPRGTGEKTGRAVERAGGRAGGQAGGGRVWR